MRGDATKLPKWAQAEIARLERSVAYWQAKASEGPEDSTVFLDDFSDAPRPLGEDPIITFKRCGMGLADIRVSRMKPGSNVLDISCTEGTLEVTPQSGNVIRVRAGRWWDA